MLPILEQWRACVGERALADILRPTMNSDV